MGEQSHTIMFTSSDLLFFFSSLYIWIWVVFALIRLIQFILFYSLCLYSFVKHWEPNSTLSAQIHVFVSFLITPKQTILFNFSVCYLLYRCNCFHATHKYLCKLHKEWIIWSWSSCISIGVVPASQNNVLWGAVRNVSLWEN